MIPRILAFGFCLAMAALPSARGEIIRENKGPTEAELTDYVKSRLPAWLSFQCLLVKTSEVTEKKAAYKILLTISPTETLFLEATNEAIPELQKAKLPDGLTAPFILKKGKGAREVLEIPVDIQYHWMKDKWEAISFEDNQQLASFGKPRSEFALNAAVFGSNEAKTAITQFRKDLAKATAPKKKSRD